MKPETKITNNADVTPLEARTIAKEAYVYGFPVVDNYRVQYGYFVDAKNPEYKATGLNWIFIARNRINIWACTSLTRMPKPLRTVVP